MSAFMVNREHIRYIVTAVDRAAWSRSGFSYWNGKERVSIAGGDRDALSRVGQLLWDANLKSIHTRYPDTIGRPENIPGPCSETFVYAHTAASKLPLTPVQVFKAIHGLQYQSCEFDDWKTSEANNLLEQLERHTIKALPGYDEAEWSIDEDTRRSA